MHSELDAAEEQRSGTDDRRKLPSQLAYMSKLSRIQHWVILVALGVIATLATICWQMYSYRGWIAYMQCASLYAQGVNEKTCEVYRDLVERNTNIKNPGGTINGVTPAAPVSDPAAIPPPDALVKPLPGREVDVSGGRGGRSRLIP